MVDGAAVTSTRQTMALDDVALVANDGNAKSILAVFVGRDVECFAGFELSAQALGSRCYECCGPDLFDELAPSLVVPQASNTLAVSFVSVVLGF